VKAQERAGASVDLSFARLLIDGPRSEVAGQSFDNVERFV
jgi:hypothetical protein